MVQCLNVLKKRGGVEGGVENKVRKIEGRCLIGVRKEVLL